MLYGGNIRHEDEIDYMKTIKIRGMKICAGMKEVADECLDPTGSAEQGGAPPAAILLRGSNLYEQLSKQRSAVAEDGAGWTSWEGKKWWDGGQKNKWESWGWKSYPNYPCRNH